MKNQSIQDYKLSFPIIKTHFNLYKMVTESIISEKEQMKIGIPFSLTDNSL